jgi:hypothetical protein
VAAGTALQTYIPNFGQVQQQKLNQCCYITVEPETRASENGICLTQQRLYDKKIKVIKIVMFL